jgi:hypothetical protein
MMVVCFENAYGAPRENSNMLQGSYCVVERQEKDSYYIRLSYVVKWG